MRKRAVLLGMAVAILLVFVLGARFLLSRAFPMGSVIVEARSKARRDVERSFEDVDTYCVRAGFTHYDTGTLDYCDKGQHNWKVNATFNNRCRYQVTKYYGFSGDFRVKMMQLDSALVEWGWARSAGGLRSMLTQYYDRWYGPGNRKPMGFPDRYVVSNLPSVEYTRGSFRLFVRYAETDPTGQEPLVFFDEVSTIGLSYREGRVVDVRALLPTMLEKNRYALAIEIRAVDYFVN